MPYVENTTGVPMIFDGVGVGINSVIEVTEDEAVALQRGGWTIVDGPPVLEALRKPGLRGALPEVAQVFHPLSKYTLAGYDDLVVPSEPFGYGLTLSLPMADNDRLGDCTIAGAVHMAQICALLAGVEWTYPGDAVVSDFYFHLTGGPDSGLMLSTVLTALSQSNPLDFQLAGVAQLQKPAYKDVRTATYNFGCAYLAVDLPQSAENDFGNGKTWRLNTPPDGPVGGHCIVSGGDKSVLSTDDPSPRTDLLDVATWAAWTQATSSWWNYYGSQCYVVLPQWYVDSNHSILGVLDVDAWQADMREISGQ